jgi:cholinesterase
MVGEIVETTSGSVVGHASLWKPAVSEYLGIPFAQPPIGNLRFAAPLPYKGDGKQTMASKYVSFDNYH